MGLRRSEDAEGRGWRDGWMDGTEWSSKFFFFFFLGWLLTGYCGCEDFAVFGRRAGRLLVKEVERG